MALPSGSKPVPSSLLNGLRQATYGKTTWGLALLLVVWILGSAWWLDHLIEDTSIHLARGLILEWLGISTTAVLLSIALHRKLRQFHRAVESLQADEERWKRALEGSNLAVWDWNIETNEVYFSPSWKSMLGHEIHEIEPSLSEWESRVHPDDLPHVKEVLNAHLERRIPTYASEHRIRCKDGSYKWILDQGKVMKFTSDGRPLRMFGTHSDISGRKRIDAERQQWADAFRHCAHGIAMTDPDSNRILVCNPAYAEMHQWNVDGMTGQDILEHYHPSDLETVCEHVVEADRVGHVRYEARKRRRNGSTFVAEVDIISARNDQGRIPYRIVSQQDITARRQAQRLQALSAGILQILNDSRALPDASERLLNAIRREIGIDAAGIRLRKDGQFPYAATYGFTQDFIRAESDLSARDCQGKVRLDAKGKVCLECTCGLVLSGLSQKAEGWCTPEGSIWTNDARPFLHLPSNQDPRLHPRNRCIHEGYQSVALIPIRADDEIVGLLQLNDRRSGFFNVEMVRYFETLAGSFGVALLRLKEADSLRERLELQDRLAKVAMTVPGMIFSFRLRPDGTACLPFCTPILEELWGLQPSDLLDDFTPAFSRIHPDDFEQVHQSVLDSARTLSPWRNRFRVFHPTRGELWLEGHSMPQREPDGSVLWHGFVQDITDRTRLEEQMHQTQRLEAVGQLAGGVAHDFNNILAATLIHLGLLRINPEIDDNTQQALKELESNVHRAATLTRQLLMFSRRSPMSVRPVDVNGIITHLLKMLTRLIGENIQLNFDATNSLPCVEADAGMVEQVIVNLVVNARDAMPKGGTITIRTDLKVVTDQGPGQRPGRFVCITVTDTGQGMDAATRKRIFEPFFTTKEIGKGTGLGLATVHGIVGQHQGWIQVSSEVGHGSAFQVFLPSIDQPTTQTLPSTTPNPLRRGHETVLVVEDDPSVRSVVVRSLSRLGYRVHQAPNGKEALNLWHSLQGEVDLLLTDMVMPEGLTGLELAEQLISQKPGLRAIISSGYSAEIAQDGVADRPGITYLPKPYEMAALADAIQTQLVPPTSRITTPASANP